jgi:hypothetical protein
MAADRPYRGFLGLCGAGQTFSLIEDRSGSNGITAYRCACFRIGRAQGDAKE